MPTGTTMLVDFEIHGIQFTALNGGSQFTPDEAISFQILCEDQAEIDRYWDALVDGGEEKHCGWLKDRFCVSWQNFPESMYGFITGGGPARIQIGGASWRERVGKYGSLPGGAESMTKKN